MTTFSQLVDKMVLETRRPDLRTEIASYLNQVVRELHFEPERGNVVYFDDNYREEVLTVDTVQSQTWTVPNMALFQGLVAARFDGIYSHDGKRVYAKRVSPGPRIEIEDYYYYSAGQVYVFGGRVGYGAIGSTISLAYYEFPKGLKYYATAARPATWDDETGFAYHEDYDDTDELKATAEALVTNWLILRWAVVVEEGLRAKVYKRVSDDSRARLSYSLYSQLRMGVFTSGVAHNGEF